MKPNKYKAQKSVVDGITFDSKKEANRYKELKLLEKAGKIEMLELQPKFLLLAADGSETGKKVGFYKADFRYRDIAEFKNVVEDVKGVRTPVYRLKKKIVEACYNIKIVEV